MKGGNGSKAKPSKAKEVKITGRSSGKFKVIPSASIKWTFIGRYKATVSAFNRCIYVPISTWWERAKNANDNHTNLYCTITITITMQYTGSQYQ